MTLSGRRPGGSPLSLPSLSLSISFSVARKLISPPSDYRDAQIMLGGCRGGVPLPNTIRLISDRGLRPRLRRPETASARRVSVSRYLFCVSILRRSRRGSRRYQQIFGRSKLFFVPIRVVRDDVPLEFDQEASLTRGQAPPPPPPPPAPPGIIDQSELARG